MPLYEYYCGRCRKLYEIIAPADGRKTHKCECGGLAIKLISVPAVKTSKKSPDKPLGPSPGYSELICGE